MGFLSSNVQLLEEANTTLNQLKGLLTKKHIVTSTARNISLCYFEKKNKKKPPLEANIKMKLINFYPPAGKFFISCQFAIQTYKSSIKCVNSCKFVASFPCVFAVSCTRICYKNLGRKVQLICLCSWFFSFFSTFELCITMYLRKFALSRIPSHHDITCFLAH